MIFDYLPASPGDMTTLTPMLFVQLEGDDIAQTYAVIDTGATHTSIPLSLAKSIGLIRTKFKERRTMGASGSFIEDVCILKKMSILKDSTDFHTFENIEVSVARHDKLPVVLLGRDNLFNAFKIKFRERDKQFDMEPY